MNPLDKVLKQTPEKKEDPVQTESQTISVVSDLDRSIIERVKSQPKTLDEIDSIVVEKKEDGKHNLSLLDELKPYEKKYAFCWILRKTRSIDEARQQYHWSICTQSYFPDVPRFHFSSNGVIERGDNILLFRPKHIEDEMRKQPGIDSINKIKNQIGSHENDAAFYTPESEFEKGPDGKTRKVPVVGI